VSEYKLVGQDIGEPEQRGFTGRTADGYDIVAGGKDIWGKADQFHYAYTEVRGDFEATVRLESLSSADLYTKAGIMARQSLAADSAHVFFQVFPDNSLRNKNNGGYEFQYRETAGGGSAAIYPDDYTSEPPAFPVQYPNTWLKLQRSGDGFHSFYSTDGNDWKPYSSYTAQMDQTVLLGLAVTAHSKQATTVASFRELTIR